jgi:hypothetical protein
MYTPRQILNGIKNPRLVAFEIYRQINKRKAIKIMEEDWDNLLILDACRYDLFEEVNSLPGELRMVRSLGSTTGEFLTANFASGTFRDTVYVSANPHIHTHEVAGRFHESVPLWETDWDDKLRTVPPGRVVERALEVEDTHPNKRLIIHFVQPHYPFIGEVGREIRHGEMTGNGVIKDERTYASIWDRLENGAIGEERVWEAYRENLKLTLPHVRELLEALTGKSVVTSDHGNALGEWNLYGHPGGKHIPSLVEVPWLVVERDNRKIITEGTVGTDREKEPPGGVESKLEALGYK